MTFIPKIKVELVIPAERVNEVVNIVRNAAQTGTIGDGKIFVYDIEQTVRIRTGETGPEAL